MNQGLEQQSLVELELDIIISVGPDVQAQGFGWSLGSWGGYQ